MEEGEIERKMFKGLIAKQKQDVKPEWKLVSILWPQYSESMFYTNDSFPLKYVNDLKHLFFKYMVNV